MPFSEPANLRRARVRVHAQLNKLEPQVAACRAKLAEIEAAIDARSPDLFARARRYKHNQFFSPRETTRLAIDVLREAGEPLPIGVIAVRMLEAKGIPLPDPATQRSLRKRLSVVMSYMDKRGITVRIGDGNASLRAIKPT